MPPALPAGFPARFPVRDDERRPWRYRVVAGALRLLLRAVFRRSLRIEGIDEVADGGPLLIACNHLSNLDPAIIGGFTPGTNYAMAKRELFANRLISWIWAGCNTFPVDRGTADRRALRTAEEVLRRGGRLVLWVEGTRAMTPGMQRAEPGVGFLLRRTRVPVLPVAVWGTERALLKGRRLPRRVPITVRYGTVFTPDYDAAGARDNQRLADLVSARVAALLPPEYRGVYGEGAPAPA